MAVTAAYLIIHGVAHKEPTGTLAGACLGMMVCAGVGFVSIRRWTTDTRVERARLADAVRDAESERTRYIAAQAAMEMERQRVARDAAADHARTAAILTAERAAMADQFEEQRAQLVSETLEVAFKLARSNTGEETHEHERARVINFPQQQAERARSRDAQL
ncbi:hypothetical protein AB0H77_15420 [Streptomyces sp. NPDC050844]|uniref:hypothetical protein n=1 Tax=Streptomyces sp. NPDC050844 TaxID=3155790 RepID=UPI0033EDA2A8